MDLLPNTSHAARVWVAAILGRESRPREQRHKEPTLLKGGGVRFYYGQVGFGLRWRELLIKKWVILLRIFRVKLDGLIFIAQKTIIRGAAQCKPHANVRGSCRARS